MKNIVILGTGIAGMPLIRQTMRNVVLPSSNYRLTVISPNSDFVWPLAMPRGVLPGQWRDDKLIYPLAPIFEEFPAEKFEFIQEAASEVDPDRNIVAVGEREIQYHTLIVATGTRTKDGFPWKIVGTSAETERLLHKTQKQIEEASSVAVIGGGVTGAETAGELGYEYARHDKKEVYLIYNGDLPLAPDMVPRVRKQTVIELERLNVKLIPSTKVIETTQRASGQTKLVLQNNGGSTKTLTVDLAIPATGMVPNSSFMPSSMLDKHGYIHQNGYLRTPSHSNIFVVGDVGSLDPSRAFFADPQIVWLVKHLPRYFSHNGELPAEPYRREGAFVRNVEALTVGKDKGVGTFGTWKMPSLVVWWVKGRHMGTDYAGDLAKGKRTMMVTFEK
ncbi:FAD/NAD(P)-binding domain-containing protein [Sarocladium strictum]